MTRATSRRLGVALVLGGLAWLALPASGVSAQESGIAVRYRSADTVYLDAGRAAGIAVGDRFEVLREGRPIAELEVVFVADYSASCRIVVERGAIQPNDAVRRLGEAGPSAEEAPAQAPPAVAAESAAGGYPQPPSRQRRRRSQTRVSGSLTFDWESFTDDGAAQLDFQRTAARLNLRLRDIGGSPYELRLRLRAQENRRERGFDERATETESRDRLYEAALIYEPPGGRFAYRIGRIGTSPFVAVGYLDGALGQVRLVRGVDVGAFFGSRPLIEDIDFESFGEKYGFFTRFSGGGSNSYQTFELFVAGVREEGELDVSREYVALETRWAPGKRWSFYQRAELDLNNGWREELTGTSSQLSNLSVALNARVGAHGRFSLSYDSFERYRTEETRFIPRELFDDLQRQGLRARLSLGDPRGLSFNLNAGLRDREGDSDNTVSYGAGIRHGDIASWGLSLAADATAFSNELTDGYLATMRAAKRFRGGHQLSLTLGGRLSQDNLFDEEDRTTEWLRVGGWFELPASLYGRAEFEVTTGDELEGQRLSLGLGYRF